MIIWKWHIYKVILRRPFLKELKLRNVGSGEMAITVYPEKTLRSKSENQQQTRVRYGVTSGIRTQATLVGGECSHH